MLQLLQQNNNNKFCIAINTCFYTSATNCVYTVDVYGECVEQNIVRPYGKHTQTFNKYLVSTEENV